jgi:geranylgeranyl pyrophosphate synthase
MIRVSPSLCETHAPATDAPPEGNALARLISAELDQPRLSETLGAGSERVHERHWRAALSDPLLEVLGRDGKYFRSRLVEVAYRLGAGAQATPMPEALPLLVEVLHAGSLIIDDIEDDSATRRGRPALHVLYGVPLALNAGNWLYFLPHRVLEGLRLDAHVELRLRRAIDRCVLRCHYGQALDLGVRLGSLSQAEVFDVVSLSTRLKTGSLLELAAEIGAVAGGAGQALQSALSRFARRYGVALQMLDDTSGLYQPTRAHKLYEDLLLGRPTWPFAWLSQQLDEFGYSRLQHQAQAVQRRQLEPATLASVLRRKLGDSPQQVIHEGLLAALHELEARVPDQSLLEPLRQEMVRLERAYV